MRSAFEEIFIGGLAPGPRVLSKERRGSESEGAKKEQEAPDICAICRKEITEDSHKARWQWEMDQGALLCKSCFEKKDTDYNKKTNFCAICYGKLGMFYYHPKPAWHIEGNLCRKCWDRQNNNGS